VACDAWGVSVDQVRADMTALVEACGGMRQAARAVEVHNATFANALRGHCNPGANILLPLYGPTGGVLKPAVRQLLRTPSEALQQPRAAAPAPEICGGGVTVAELLNRARVEREELETRLDEVTGEIVSLEGLAARMGVEL
jgi:hypothetical protein